MLWIFWRYNPVGPTAKVSVSVAARAIRITDEPDRMTGLKQFVKHSVSCYIVEQLGKILSKPEIVPMSPVIELLTDSQE